MSYDEMQIIWTRFNSNLAPLWLFTERISRIINKEDEKQLSQIADRIAQLFNDDPIKVEKELQQFIKVSDDADIEPNLLERPDVQEVIEVINSGEFNQMINAWLNQFPRKRNKFFETLSYIFEPPIANSYFLCRGTFVLLVSFFEIFIVDLLRIRYGIYPQKQIVNTLKTLHPTKSDERIINNGNFHNRLKLIKKNEIDTNSIEGIEIKVFEIIQKRNLLIHKDGIIDQEFVKYFSTKNSNYAIGRRLHISEKYLTDSIETIYLYSYLLFQICWRSWSKAKNKKADEHFNNVVFNSLRQNRNNLVILLTSHEKDFKVTLLLHQTLIINHAIALRDLSQEGEVLKLINSQIQRPANQTVKLALYILKGDYDLAIILLKNLIASGKTGGISRDWPLFRPLLNDKRFSMLLEKLE